ncbi:hypothetical protein BDB00DRAFT_841442 [Zychaea mexicana]|uniref:uncharacterized protein n=1 Tax=Zychaea mexicana TaxID=64656 RepID=UPI0022FEF508|nr:uncharacterized protein BDB00DRAFT_841442 [Zychaea mexicana]KAI9489796.1 hypothetical protein BDB00DRAFT_841442 [Zychaea mexicana]
MEVADLLDLLTITFRIKTKGSFKNGLKREGLATVDVNRFPRPQQQQQQDEGQQLKPSTKQCSSDKLDAYTAAASAVKCNYSSEDLVTIRRNLSANLTLAKRRMMVKLSQSKTPQDMQMYEYLTTESSDRSKKRKSRKIRKSMKTTTTKAATAAMTGGKLKYHRPRPLSLSCQAAATTSTALQEATPAVVAASSFLPSSPQAAIFAPEIAAAQEPPPPLSPPEPLAEPAVALDILFGGYHEEAMMTTDEEPGSLCDPSSSPLMPACVRDPGEEKEEGMWDVSNHAAGLLNDLMLCNGNEQISSVVGVGEPIDFWLQTTMALDQEMSGKKKKANPATEPFFSF